MYHEMWNSKSFFSFWYSSHDAQRVANMGWLGIQSNLPISLPQIRLNVQTFRKPGQPSLPIFAVV